MTKNIGPTGQPGTDPPGAGRHPWLRPVGLFCGGIRGGLARSSLASAALTLASNVPG